MVERVDAFLASYSLRAISEIEECLEQYDAVELDATELNRFGAKTWYAGWKFPVEFSNKETFWLVLLAPRGGPHAMLRLAVLNPPPLGSWPHLEAMGLLCVYPPDSSMAFERLRDVVHQLVVDGTRLIEEALSESNLDDFREEFVSYWNLLGQGRRTVRSLVSPQKKNRIVWSWSGKNLLAVADSPEELSRWFFRVYKRDISDCDEIVPALLIWLDEVPLPAKFPTSGLELKSLIAQKKDEQDLLAQIFNKCAGVFDVVIGVDTPSGVGFGTVRVSEPKVTGAPGRRSSAITKGFRPGKVPAKIALARRLGGNVAVERSQVDRVDHDWIHGRGYDPQQAILKESKVVVVGAGSLGSGVADLLAKSGVPDIYIIDNERLSWPNLSRNVLGADHIEQSKSEELAKLLTKNLPHLANIDAVNAKFCAEANLDWERITQASLIVSTTGVWACDSFLNYLRVNGFVPSVLFGWLEPRAIAAHAVFISQSGGCLRCGTDARGRPVFNMANWSDGGRLQVPACGGGFSPYGAADVAWAHAMIASEVIRHLVNSSTSSSHKIWAGFTADLEVAGGCLSSEWKDEFGSDCSGRVVERSWHRIEDCPACKDKKR
ncbi:ThiF family adenylyltransferase [Thalassospira lucentensis]|uniref:ThiF family adenylyltransferase n=1 Tax=Thalassospira lucentensis TaxID=168935 RepID=UPI0003B40FCC|nr:ThiF family adenylyltransferase [Thalassospira lucentensis]RCK27742.1 hypothetical protein TH1_10725 [Thalassospira lucentensis MCCC 1A00383 = DSM 14000]